MKVIYAQSPMYRKLEYNVLTQIAEIDGKRFVLKKALNEQAIPFVNGLEKNYQEMVKQYGVEHVAKGELLSPGIFKMEYIYGESFDMRCMQYFKIGDFEGFIQNIVYYYQHMLVDYTNDVLSVKDFNPMSPQRKYNIDLSFNNIIFSSNSGEFKIIDYEWLLPSVSKKFACFRAIMLLYAQYQFWFQKKEMTWEMLLSGCGLDEKDIKLCYEQGRQFYNSVLNWSTKTIEKATAMVNL